MQEATKKTRTRSISAVEKTTDQLVIKRNNGSLKDHVMILKVSRPTHAAVKALAAEVNMPVTDVADMLVQWALERVKIDDA